MKLLINENPLQLLPSLVHMVGMNEAVFLQQLHFRSLISKNIRDGHKWVYNTYDEWLEEFTFWSYSTMTRIVYKLEKEGYLISTSAHNRMSIDKTKWYRIDYSKFPDAFTHIEKPNSPQWKEGSPQSEEPALLTLKRPITKELKNIKNKDIVENHLDVAHFVINYLNEKTGKHFKPQSAATRKFINGRIKEGYTQEDFIRVIDLKTKQWLNDREFSAFLRPSTLFNATNFENYLNEQAASRKVKARILQPPVLDFNKGED